MTEKAWAVIVCGGSGERMGGAINKTLLPVAGVPSAVRALRAFHARGMQAALVVKSCEQEAFVDTLALYGEAADRYAEAGRDRQESVYRGLSALPDDTEIVLVHDGARGLLSEALIDRVLESVRLRGSGIAALHVTDTVKKVGAAGEILDTLDRSALCAVQTPQGFRYRELLAAHRRAAENAAARYTDDAALMEREQTIYTVPGDKRNMKLTTPEDIRTAEAFFERRTRVGFGLDAHRLVEGRKLILGGVEIPYEKGLLGHSDADAALHALMDAMLGAAALGDIGKCFPDTDEAYAGISSLILLQKTNELLLSRGCSVAAADITIVAQRPKLSPYIGQMREIIARTLSVSADCVSVKATTTEGMGYEGRGEGISAHAVATVTQWRGDFQ